MVMRASGGTAILANSSASNNTINKGTIFGNIILDGAGNVVTNLAGGVISAPTTLNLSGGVFQNAGTLHVGGIGTIGTTTLTGDLLQSSTGRCTSTSTPLLDGLTCSRSPDERRWMARSW